MHSESSEPVSIIIREGRYHLPSGLDLRKNDSNVTYRAYGNENVMITGGEDISLDEFSHTQDPRIIDGLRDKILKINLRANGFSEPQMCITGHSQSALLQAGIESGGVSSTICANGELMKPARYPNNGYMRVSSVINSGSLTDKTGMIFTVDTDRSKLWEEAEDAYVFGYWYYDWSDQTSPVRSVKNGIIETAVPSGFGVRANQRFYIYNLLEELDEEGEWFYERSSGDLYIYPPEGADKITLASDSSDLITADMTNNITFSGLMFENASNNMITVNDSIGFSINGCRIRNAGACGIVVSGGKNANIKNTEVSSVGGTGIYIAGGDKELLIPSGHTISCCTVFNTSRIIKTYSPNIRIYGVGCTVENNTVFDSPHSAIIFSGNDHIISGNEIYDVLKETSDAGAIYCGRSLVSRGNIIKNNYIHDIASGFTDDWIYGIYLDDSFSSADVIDNIIENFAGTGIFINGGRNNRIIGNSLNNIHSFAIKITAAGLLCSSDEEFIGERGLVDGLYLTDSYRKYSDLYNIVDDEPRKPKYNEIRNNAFYDTNESIKIDGYGLITENEIRRLNIIEE